MLRRALKIGLAAMLATSVAKALELPNPWFATLAAIVAVEITLQASVRTARNATFGAAIGAVAGLTMATLAKEQIWAVGVVVLATFAVGGWVRLETIGRQAAIVSSVIVLVPETANVSTEFFAWIRFAETIIGITAALLVNALVLPPRAYRGVRRNLAGAYVQLAAMYRLVIAAEATGTRDVAAVVTARRTFRVRLRAVDNLWDEAIAEHPSVELLAPHWRATTRRIWEQCTAMDDAVMDTTASWPRPPLPRWTRWPGRSMRSSRYPGVVSSMGHGSPCSSGSVPSRWLPGRCRSPRHCRCSRSSTE